MEQSTRIGRNNPCPCGSGRKFKHCCNNKPARAAALSIPQHYLQQAQRALGIGDYFTAERNFRSVLEQQKNSPLVLAGLGHSLCKLGQTSEGITFLLRAAEHVNRQYSPALRQQPLYEIALTLHETGAIKEAWSVICEALQHPGTSAQTHYLSAQCLSRLGQWEAAISSAMRAVQLAPEEANAHILLATLQARQGDVTSARLRLEHAITIAVGETKARAHLELGVVLDELKYYDDAFEHLRTAAGLLVQSPAVERIDRQAIYRELDTQQASFTKEVLAGAESRPHGDLPSPVFLVGFYRSGTTLMEQVFAAHPETVTSDEAALIPLVLRELAKMAPHPTGVRAKLEAVGASGLKHLREYYWRCASELLGEDAQRKVFMDKTALNVIHVGLIKEIFPDAKIIFAVRDPRDVCLSCFMQSFTLTSLTVHLLSWEGIAKFYSTIFEFWQTMQQRMTTPVLELRYEDLVSDFQTHVTKMYNFVGLDWVDEAQHFYVHAQRKVIATPSFDAVKQPLYDKSVGRWRHYEKYFIPLEPHLEKAIRYYGYAAATGLR
ncbi:sulfotransferase [Nitrosomonas sp.]|uniref:sulfotransferase n=1 Tax=Nitrosomonas sp. TaxID=42353 RepID=UPI0025CD30C4|nr:sulfotransferase [Nitrosomonas sp.]